MSDSNFAFDSFASASARAGDELLDFGGASIALFFTFDSKTTEDVNSSKKCAAQQAESIEKETLSEEIDKKLKSLDEYMLAERSRELPD